MAKNVEHVSHIKSKLKTNGLPQLPSPDKLVDGEIAINYAEGVETISIKNESGSIVTFSSDNYYTEKKLGSGFTNNNATVTEAIDDLEYMVVNKEEAIAAALNDLNGRKLDASAYTPVDTSLYYKKTETSGATEIQTALNSVVDGISRQSKTIAAALNDLNAKKLDASAYTPTDLSNYYTKSETSGATEISNALGTKANTATTLAGYGITDAYTKKETSGATEIDNALNSKADKAVVDDLSGQSETVAAALVDLNATITAHTASTVHMNGTEKTNLDSLATNIAAISGLTATDIQRIRTFTRRTRLDDFDFGVLRQAVIDQDLEKYGLKVGDYKTINGYTYVIAGLNTMKGTATPCRIATNHVGIIVIPHTTCQWNTSNTTEGGYASSNLHNYLTGTTLDQVRTDLGSYASGLLSHAKLYSNRINASGYNRYGLNSGCADNWDWYNDQYISALSEIQVYGSIAWSSSGYDTGEACRQLDVFRVYNMNEIFGDEYPWLRDVASSSYACLVRNLGYATYGYANADRYVAALILFA